jgi:hypothetical protein
MTSLIIGHSAPHSVVTDETWNKILLIFLDIFFSPSYVRYWVLSGQGRDPIVHHWLVASQKLEIPMILTVRMTASLGRTYGSCFDSCFDLLVVILMKPALSEFN